MIFRSIFFLLFSFLLSFSSDAQTHAIKVDTNKTYQTMEGFGAFNTLSFWKNISNEKKFSMVVNDLGLSIMRFELAPTFQPTKNGSYNLKGIVFGGPDIEHNFEDVKALSKLGVKKFIASIWSPPSWMKTLNADGRGPTTIKGGSLREDAYDDFADYCAAYCKVFKEQTGIELYALGLQNEPEFVEPYNSCVYTPSQMKKAAIRVGKKFAAEQIATKIYLPEVLPAQKHVEDFFNEIVNDETASAVVPVFAIHNYDNDGINVGGASAREWGKYSEIARTASPAKQLWMTETSGHKNTWDGAMLLAENIYNAINYGNINAWLWWALADKKSSEVFSLIVDGQPSGRYYASKHFYHFVRPGAIRVRITSSQTDVLALAFKHSGNYRMVTVLINTSKSPATMDLPKIDGKKKIYVSDRNQECALQKNTEGMSVKLPAESIATVTWE